MLSRRAIRYLDERSIEVLDEAYLKATLPLLREVLKKSSNLSAEYLNDPTTAHFRPVLKKLGYSSFYEAFLHLSSIQELDEYVSKGGQKDMSKLNAVKRTVMRNGKPVTITVYEENGSDADSKDGKSSTEPARANSMHAEYTTDHKKAKQAMTSLKGSTTYGTKQTATLYLTITDNGGKVVAVIGYKRYGHYLKLVFVDADTKVGGTLERSFFEVVKLALSKELGVKVDKKISSVLPYKQMYNMEEDNRGDSYLGYESLVGIFGKVT